MSQSEDKKIDYSSIHLEDISKDWLKKQRLTIPGRDRVRYNLRGGISFKNKVADLTERFKTYFVECLYTIPEYKEFSDIGHGFLFNDGNSNSRNYSIKLAFLPSDFEYETPVHPHGYINKLSGVSFDGGRVVPLSEVNSPGFSPGSVRVDLIIDDCFEYYQSLPDSWFDGKNKRIDIKSLFLDRLTPDQFDKFKEMYLEYLDKEWEDTNSLSKYVDSGGFLGNILNFKQLEEKFPDLVPIYFEENKTDLMERYRGTPEGKDLIIRKGLLEGDLEAQIFKIRSSLDYLS